jgi:putative nucleotidyltransferase with HDIG domain
VAQLFQEVHIELTGKPPSAEMIFGATMHDIGKLLIPDSVLYRDGELSSAEWVLMHQHPMQGAEILERYGLPPAVCEVVRYHHEALDGSGYYGKFSDEIPFEAKIIRACDTYDAMTSCRPYRGELPQDEAFWSLIDPDIYDSKIAATLITIVSQEAIAECEE